MRLCAIGDKEMIIKYRTVTSDKFVRVDVLSFLYGFFEDSGKMNLSFVKKDTTESCSIRDVCEVMIEGL